MSLFYLRQILYSTLLQKYGLIDHHINSYIKFKIKSDQAALRVNSSSFKIHVNICIISTIYLSSAHLKVENNKSFFFHLKLWILAHLIWINISYIKGNCFVNVIKVTPNEKNYFRMVFKKGGRASSNVRSTAVTALVMECWEENLSPVQIQSFKQKVLECQIAQEKVRVSVTSSDGINWLRPKKWIICLS